MLTIASRKSDLARLQAYTVGQALQTEHPNINIQYTFSESLGDKNLTDPLWKMPEKGVFTQDLTKALIDGSCDLVVHSWKDLPTEENPLTKIVATLPREDMRDLFLLRKSSRGKRDLTILSSSPRREFNGGSFLQKVLPWRAQCHFQFVRGNIPTRIEKLRQGEGDGLFVAKAAIDRILSAEQEEFVPIQQAIRSALKDFLWMVLPLSENPAAPAQGALAVEILRSRDDLVSLLAPIHCAQTYSCATREREVLSAYGGGCHQKLGISFWPHPHGLLSSIKGLSPDGQLLQEFQFVDVIKNESVAIDHVFPTNMTENNYFEYESIEIDKNTLKTKDLFVAKFLAWPKELLPKENCCVWVAGTRTWRKLAEAGVWVNGCTDGLGEYENPKVDKIMGRVPYFLKLTHADALNYEGQSRGPWIQDAQATYRLNAKSELPNLQGKSHFFWTSYSHFQIALTRFPELKGAHHACGPGQTFNLISNALGPSARLQVFSSQKSWLRSLGHNK